MEITEKTRTFAQEGKCKSKIITPNNVPYLGFDKIWEKY